MKIIAKIFLCSLPLFFVSQAFADEAFNQYEWKQVATLPNSIGVAGPLAGSDGGALIVGGGANFPDAAPWYGGVKKYYSDIHLALKNPDGSLRWLQQETQLPQPMGYAAVAASPNGVVCLGGETAEGPVKEAFLLRYDSKSESVALIPLPPLPVATTSGSAAVLGTRVYLLGGLTESGATSKVFSLDFAKPESEWKAEPEMPRPASHAVAVAQSNGELNGIYLLGGRAKASKSETTAFSDEVLFFNPKTKSWSQETPLPRPLAAGTGLSWGINAIFLIGGDDGTFFNANEKRETQIAHTENADEKQKLLAEKIQLQEQHQGFRREVLLYNTITKVWCEPFHIPESENSQVTTNAFAFPGAKGLEILIPSGEIRPGVRTDKINSLQVIGKTSFTAIDYGVVAVYLAVMLGIGVYFMRKNETTNDFFLGGGRLPWWAVGISIFATTLSAITFLSMPAKAFATDWRMFFYNFGIILVAPIIICCYLPYFRKLNLQTAYEYLELRFNRSCRLIASGLFTVFMVTRTAIVLYLPSLALSVVSGLDVSFCIVIMAVVTILYCTFGGMEAVVWGDVIQGFILVVGAMLSLVVLVLYSDGGLFGFFETGIETGKMRMLDLRFDFSEPVLWAVVIGSLANCLITYSSDQTLVQRYMCGTDEKQTIRSIWCNACLAIPVTVIFFLIGTALFTYYRTHPQWFDAGLRNADAIYPFFIVNGLPPGVSGMVIAAIFAAAMSTLSSNINSASVAVYSDFLRPIFVNASESFSVQVSRVIGILVGLLGMGLALFLATFDIKSLWDLFNTFLGLFTGPVAGLFMMGVFSRKINGTGALVGLLVSALTVGLVQAFTSLSFLFYGATGMLSCYIIGYTVSLFYGGPAKIVVFDKVKTDEIP